MVESKGWDWEAAEKESWLDPCEESYFYCNKWKKQGKRSVLDLGCGLGRHSLLFARNGFKVTATDISPFGIDFLRKQEKEEGLNIRSLVCDMVSLPFRDNSFDCIFSYLVISHTDTEGFKKIISEIKRVLKPDGEIYITLCSKATWSFKDAGFPKIDENTVVKTNDGPEKDVPHFYVDLADIQALLGQDFDLLRIRHIDNCLYEGVVQNNSHYHVWAKVKKTALPLDFSDVIGKRVSGKIDRPLGTSHPKCKDMIYPVNYGYVPHLIAGDGAEQDVYFLGEDKPVEDFAGTVIAVLHRNNDVEDKWVVAKDGTDFTDEEILAATEFQEKYFDTELFR